jgi:hypothetical protein
VKPAETDIFGLEWTGELLFLPAPTGKSDIIAMVYNYYQRLCGERAFPKRGDIDPTEISSGLPYISIADYQAEPFRVRFRLIGSEIERHYGNDARGRWLDEMPWEPKNIDDTTLIYRRVCEERRPLFGLSYVTWEDRTDHIFEWAVFPLSDNGETITHALSVDDYTTVMPRNRRAV